MSYILNALRKSERERQAIEPDSVTNRIVVHQPPRQQMPSRPIVALIVINLAFLVYFLGFTQKTLPAATQAAAPVVQPVEVSPAERISTPRPVTKPPVPKTPAIADIVEARTAAPATPPPTKSAPAVKPLIEPVKPVLAPPQPVIHKVEPVEDIIKKPVQIPAAAAVPAPLPVPASAPVQVKNDLPFLDELPAELRRSLPDLPINVFSYASTPAERFVMIDMVKYTPGQRIKDLLELKEIRPDSIVVGYNGRTFKIKRP